MQEAPSYIAAVLRIEMECLEDFLMQGQVFRQIQIPDWGNRIHLMSLGDFLERVAVSECLAEDLRLDAQTHGDITRLLETWNRQAAHLGQREMNSRMRSLQWSLEGWHREGNLNQSYLATEMSQRARLERLGAYLGWQGAERDLHGMDAQIRSMTHEGPFMWNPAFAAAYPQPEYWFLYRAVRV